MTPVFPDTTVLVHAVDDRDPIKRDRARDWLRACWSLRCGRVSVQVLSEFYSIARKKFPSAISAGDARAEVRRYQQWRPWQIDHQTVENAWAIESRYGFNYWDALIIASAREQGCGFLLSEHLRHEQRVDDVLVVDPFRLGPDILETGPSARPAAKLDA